MYTTTKLITNKHPLNDDFDDINAVVFRDINARPKHLPKQFFSYFFISYNLLCDVKLSS